MGRLIDINDIRVKPQYMQDIMGIAMIRCEDLSRILADAPTVEAIPKDQYESRLKADMVAMLTDIKLEIEKQSKIPNNNASAYDWNNGVYACYKVIQQKIDALKADGDND